MTKIPKTKRQKCEMNKTIETSIIPWGETEVGFNDYKEKFVCGTLKEVRIQNQCDWVRENPFLSIPICGIGHGLLHI